MAIAVYNPLHVQVEKKGQRGMQGRMLCLGIPVPVRFELPGANECGKGKRIGERWCHTHLADNKIGYVTQTGHGTGEPIEVDTPRGNTKPCERAEQGERRPLRPAMQIKGIPHTFVRWRTLILHYILVKLGKRRNASPRAPIPEGLH